MSKTNRRDFLISTAPIAAAPLLLPLFSQQLIARPLGELLLSGAPFQNQEEWRYCDKCTVLFFNGGANKGRCQAGGGHEAQGNDFLLQYGNSAEIPNQQINWRFCDKCSEMFFDGSPNKGRCPAGNGHHAQGFNFRLPHDINTNANYQSGWRFCNKCSAMFYDGAAYKGKCPAGAGHVAQGFQFVLPHRGAPDIHLRSDVRTPGWAPIGGWVDLVVKQNGDYVFSGHMHNSGAVNIRYTLGVVLATPSGQAFGFAIHNHQVDGTQTIINPKRDHDWKVQKNDPKIAQNWNQVAQGTLHWKLAASDTVTSGIERFLGDIAKEACPTPDNQNKFVPCQYFYSLYVCVSGGC
jgi:hypothetical protein